MHKIKVIYILGHGRSGSTLLELMLSTQTGSISLGQFVGLETVVKDSDSIKCSCGQHVPFCDRWGEVINQQRDMLQGHSEIYMRNPFFEKGHRINQLVRSIKYMVTAILPSVAAVDVKHQKDLLNKILDTSGGSYFIDSSKNINRYLALLASNEFDVTTVFLIRDMIGVTRSKRKTKSERQSGIALASFSWAYQNLISLAIYNKLRCKKIFIEYDQILDKPDDVIEKVIRIANIENKIVVTNREIDTTPLHMLTGNRIKDAHKISIKHQLGNNELGGAIFEKFFDVMLGKPIYNFLKRSTL